DQKSTVDYIGNVQGIPVCFDAKECAADTFPLMNIHEHQIKFMDDWESQDGVAFIILYYTHLNEMYYIPYRKIKEFYDRSLCGGRKSFRYEEIQKEYTIRNHSGVPVHFLEAMQMDLNNRNK
ncbi:MAG: Holliday junction resolvase RecU, partial [Eubacterium sp.]